MLLKYSKKQNVIVLPYYLLKYMVREKERLKNQKFNFDTSASDYDKNKVLKVSYNMSKEEILKMLQGSKNLLLKVLRSC